jgi:DNA-binding GntR family transcriptional regulator
MTDTKAETIDAPHRVAGTRAASPERDLVYRQLVLEIARNQLMPGARLVEADIASRTGVRSRSPVREALLRLEREGFAVGERHHGFRVAPLDEQAARELFPMVGGLQGLAVVESGPLLASRLEPLRRANEHLGRVRGRPLEAMAADAEFHRILISLCPNRRLLALIDTLHHQLLRYEHMFMSDEALIETSIAQHSEIIDRIENGDTAGAERAVRANYASGLAAVIAKLRL